MLSDEEKKAIDIIKTEIKAFEAVITAMKKEIDNKDWLRKNILEIKEDILVRKTLLNLIEKQSKEIEELKDESKEYQIGFVQGRYEKDLDWNGKIKAKIEELNKDFKEYENGQEWEIQDEIRGQIEVLQSLLEKE